MKERISKIPNKVQDKESEAWKKLCQYIEELAISGKDTFAPREYLGEELFAQVYTLPTTIKKLKKVKKIQLYGSQLKRIPPEIGEMTALKYFDVYTSYNLFWFPFEITKCKRLIDSRMSTRVLYGNFKNRKGFPKLDHNPVRYESDTISCSICEKEITQEETNQWWVTKYIGTDTVPLLANVCSQECKGKLPEGPKSYIRDPHRGGADLQQPTYEDWESTYMEEVLEEDQKSPTNFKLLKLIKNIWDSRG